LGRVASPVNNLLTGGVNPFVRPAGGWTWPLPGAIMVPSPPARPRPRPVGRGAMSAHEQQPSTVALETLGRYQLLRKLGQGGIGAVYLASDSRLDRDVAVKVLPPESVNDPDAVARFRREAKALAKLSHPGIVH